MRPLKCLALCVLAVLVGYGLASPLAAQSFNSHSASCSGIGLLVLTPQTGWSSLCPTIAVVLGQLKELDDKLRAGLSRYAGEADADAGVLATVCALLPFGSRSRTLAISLPMGVPPIACVPFRPPRIMYWRRQF